MTAELITAVVALRVAYLAVGVVLCLIGRSLIVRGISAPFETQGDVAKVTFKVVTASPGLVFAMAGLIVIGLAIFRQAELPLPVGGATTSTGTARFADESAFSDVVSALQERRIDEAGPALVRAWRSNPMAISLSLTEPSVRQAVVPAIRSLLDRPDLGAAMPGKSAEPTLGIIRQRLHLVIAMEPRLKDLAADATVQLAQLDVARRQGNAAEVARLLVASFDRNPTALLAHIESTRPEDWPQSPGLFAPLRKAIADVARNSP